MTSNKWTYEEYEELLTELNSSWLNPSSVLEGPSSNLSGSVVPMEQAASPQGGQLGPTRPKLYYKSYLRGDESNPYLQAVRDLAAHPQLYRLRHVQQLSTTSFSRVLGATHHRLSHCLGTLDIASVMLQSSSQTRTAGLKPPRPYQTLAALLFALLHDAFHGPYGHSMEFVGEYFYDTDSRRIDKALLVQELQDADSPLRRLLKERLDVDEDTKDKAIQFLELLVNKEVLMSDPDIESPRPYHLAQIVDGILDADRLDYVHRDQDYCEGRNPGLADYLARSCVTVEAVYGERASTRLAVKDHARDNVQKLLDERRRLYNEYYEHPEKSVFDEMVLHAVLGVFESDGPCSNPTEKRKLGRLLFNLTDAGLELFVRETTRRPHMFLFRQLFSDFLSNRPFRLVWAEGLEVEHAQQIYTLSDELGSKLTSLAREHKAVLRPLKAKPNLSDEDLSRCKRIFDLSSLLSGMRETLSDAIDIDRAARGVSLFHLQSTAKQWNFKYALERHLWHKLLQRASDDVAGAPYGGLSALRSGVIGAMEKEGLPSEEAAQVWENVPLVYLSLHVIPPQSPEALEQHNKSAEKDELLVYSPARDGNKETHQKQEIKLNLTRRTHEYRVSIIVPALLAECEQSCGAITELWQSLVDTWEWYFVGLAAG